jgi:hypothetical protein
MKTYLKIYWVTLHQQVAPNVQLGLIVEATRVKKSRARVSCLLITSVSVSAKENSKRNKQRSTKMKLVMKKQSKLILMMER